MAGITVQNFLGKLNRISYQIDHVTQPASGLATFYLTNDEFIDFEWDYEYYSLKCEDNVSLNFTAPSIRFLDDKSQPNCMGIMNLYDRGAVNITSDTLYLRGVMNVIGRFNVTSGIADFNDCEYPEILQGKYFFGTTAKLLLKSSSVSKTLIKASTLTGTITLALDESFPENGSFSIEATDNQLVINDGEGYAVSSSTSGNVTTYSVERVSTTKEVKSLKIDGVSYPVKDETARAGLAGKQNSISDLDAIRSGATAGATALQPNDNITELNNNAGYITSSYHDSTKQDTLVSGTNIKTINSTSLLGSGNISVQQTLVSGTNIKTVNGNSLLGSGNIVIQGGGSSIEVEDWI